MEKKIIGAAAAIVFAGGMFMAGRYIVDSGILRGYPDAEYLTSEEAEHRPIYGQLTKDEKAVYTALYRGIEKKEEKIPLPMEVNDEEYSRIYCILEKQESRFFYLDSLYYTAMKVRDAKIVYRDKDISMYKESELESAVQAAIDEAYEGLGEAEKVRYINDYIVRKCRYVSGDENEYASTSYGCLVRGQANCEGYAKSFVLLASELGLDSVVVTGKTDKGENHAWNQVKVDDIWYNIDVTWADDDKDGTVRLMYFLCDDREFSKTHIADNTLFEPYRCSNNDENYYVHNGLSAESSEEAEEIVRRELLSGNGVIDIKFKTQTAYNDFKEEFLNNENLFKALIETGYPYDEEVEIALKEVPQELCMTIDFTGKGAD